MELTIVPRELHLYVICHGEPDVLSLQSEVNKDIKALQEKVVFTIASLRDSMDRKVRFAVCGAALRFHNCEIVEEPGSFIVFPYMKLYRNINIQNIVQFLECMLLGDGEWAGGVSMPPIQFFFLLGNEFNERLEVFFYIEEKRPSELQFRHTSQLSGGHIPGSTFVYTRHLEGSTFWSDYVEDPGTIFSIAEMIVASGSKNTYTRWRELMIGRNATPRQDEIYCFRISAVRPIDNVMEILLDLHGRFGGVPIHFDMPEATLIVVYMKEVKRCPNNINLKGMLTVEVKKCDNLMQVGIMPQCLASMEF